MLNPPTEKDRLMREILDHFKSYMDAFSLATVLATLAAWLPPMAALVSLIWGLLRIYESVTVQSMLLKRRRRRKAQFCMKCAHLAASPPVKEPT